MKNLKFKILPKVRSFTTGDGVEHFPGDSVNLPESYKGETWLEPVEKPKKVQAAPVKLTLDAPHEAEPKVPLEKPKRQK